MIFFIGVAIYLYGYFILFLLIMKLIKNICRKIEILKYKICESEIEKLYFYILCNCKNEKNEND